MNISFVLGNESRLGVRLGLWYGQGICLVVAWQGDVELTDTVLCKCPSQKVFPLETVSS